MAVPDQVSAPSWNHRSLGHSTPHAFIGRTLTRGSAEGLPAPAPAAPTAQAPVPAGTPAAAVGDAAVFAARQRLRNGGNDPADRALVDRYLKLQNTPHTPVSFAVPPSGITPSVQMSYNNSRNRGDTNITHNPTFNISGGDLKNSLESARMVADRGTKDLVRNMRAVEA